MVIINVPPEEEPSINLGRQGLCFKGTSDDDDRRKPKPKPKPDPDMLKLILHAIKSGITYFDTPDDYGPGIKEIIREALKEVPREKVQIATKFSVGLLEGGSREISVVLAHVKAACEDSLRTLGVHYIDLYYIHRLDEMDPIEIIVGAMKKLVEDGKVKFIGLSDPSPGAIIRANAVHPISAVKVKWSLWSRAAEEKVIPICEDYRIRIVPSSPLGKEFCNRIRQSGPRFKGENVDMRYDPVTEVARRYACTISKLALAWVHHHGDGFCPLLGATSIEDLNDNIGALSVKLTPEDMAVLQNTPPLSSWKADF